MKLEFIEDGLDGGPLILIYGRGCDEVLRLRTALRGLAEEVGRRVAIHELPGVESVDGCRMTAVSAKSDPEIIASASDGSFEWTLDQESWREVGELLEPFCEEQSGDGQYLNRHHGPQIMYSTDRRW